MIRVTWSLNVAMIIKRLSFQVRFVGTTGTWETLLSAKLPSFCVFNDSCNSKVGERG